MKRLIVAVLLIACSTFMLCAGNTNIAPLLSVVDSVTVNKLSSTRYTYSGAVNLAPHGEAWCSDTVLTDTLGTGEYAVLHRATIWGAVLADRYLYSIHVRMNGNLSDGNELTYQTGAWGGSDTITTMHYLDLLADGAVMVFQPGDTFHIDVYNDDLDADSLRYVYVFEKIRIE